MKNRVAIVTGISGQDGSYLAPMLLDKGYEVHAILRRTSNDPTIRLNDLFSGRKVFFHEGNLRDLNRIREIMEEVVPDEVYNLAAQSHVGTSFTCPDETWDINYYGTGRVVNEALRVNPSVRIYQASTSEMFGNSPAPQSEETPFLPESPYAMAKLRAHEDFVVNKRLTQNAFTVSGFLFNHESPRRGKQFVTRKITHSLAKIRLGKQSCVELGNLNAVRDWGYAGDYVKAMYLMLQQEKPEDYVIASGETHTVREFIESSAKYFGYKIMWEGNGEKEVGRDGKTGEIIVRVNPEFYRPREVNFLQGDSSKAKKSLGWKPEVSFSDLVTMMCESDMMELRHIYGVQDDFSNIAK
ncbi:MAG: GDP-mannose 4,6-dehydratase [Bdellovibrionales bacterium]|nr:GDP-mannose 4,6-dehydratase [Bdellovibrionales bacterium]